MYDRPAFDRQWQANIAVTGYVATHIPEATSAVIQGTVGRAIDLTVAGHPGEAIGELGLWGIGGLRRGVAHAADDAVEGAASRLARDSAVDGLPAPARLRTDRAVGNSATQNAYVQAEVARLEALGARDIRVNQTQVNIWGERVGINRPDLQYTLAGRRYYREFEVPGSLRGDRHVERINANDPFGDARWLPVP